MNAARKNSSPKFSAASRILVFIPRKPKMLQQIPIHFFLHVILRFRIFNFPCKIPAAKKYDETFPLPAVTSWWQLSRIFYSFSWHVRLGVVEKTEQTWTAAVLCPYVRLVRRTVSRSLPATALGRFPILNRVTQRSVFS